MSRIVTFYSYKGGVGRSMALANMAVLLARRGLRVLTVDWDLEAPGLERYFNYFEVGTGGTGLLRMCMEATAVGIVDYREFATTFDGGGAFPITLLTSGREADEAYTRNLEAFRWDAFFSRGGGRIIEQWRDQWRKDFDVTLIDSRTGLSDAGGICTIQLPDIIIAMFTANLQSLYGVRDVMRLAQKARQSLAYDRMRLSILPVAARWGVQEFQETRTWLDRAAEATKEFFEDWLPKGLAPRDIIEATKVPQISYFGFGERLAVVEQGVTDPQGMGFVYDKLASFVASDLERVGALIGDQKVQDAVGGASLPHALDRKPQVSAEGYLYDVFFSYDNSMSEWVIDFVDLVKAHLAVLRGQEPRTFIDIHEIRVGDTWLDATSEALRRSKVMVAFITPRYLSSPLATLEFYTFSARARATGRSVLLPVLLRGEPEDLPAFVRVSQPLDLRHLIARKTGRRESELQLEAQQLANLLTERLDLAPDFNPRWEELTNSSKAELDYVRSQLAGMSVEYTRIRSNTVAGDERNRQMEAIVSKMRTVAQVAVPLLPALAEATAPGDRLAAIAILQVVPQPAYIEWLGDRCTERQPFVGSHAAIAMLASVRTLDCTERARLETAIQKGLTHFAEMRPNDRSAILGSALEELRARCPEAAPQRVG